MRDYLYLWHHPEKRRVIASGLLFADVAPKLACSPGGIVLLKHQHEDSLHDFHSGLDYVNHADISAVSCQNIYSWGDACWADFAGETFPVLAKESVAELLYFGHAKEPLRDVVIPGLGNRYLAAAHDDGWRLLIYYSDWETMIELFSSLPCFAHLQGRCVLENREHAVWIDETGVFPQEPTWDIDGVISRRQQMPS